MLFFIIGIVTIVLIFAVFCVSVLLGKFPTLGFQVRGKSKDDEIEAKFNLKDTEKNIKE